MKRVKYAYSESIDRLNSKSWILLLSRVKKSRSLLLVQSKSRHESKILILWLIQCIFSTVHLTGNYVFDDEDDESGDENLDE